MIPRFGEIYTMQFGGTGCEQTGWRPGLVFQNNMGNAYSPNIIALPLTSSLKKRHQPTHVVLPAHLTGLRKDSMVLCENPERMSKERIGNYITTLSEDFLSQIAAAYLLASSALAFINPVALMELRERAVILNG